MITITRADYHDPQHGYDIVSLLDAYARDPMGGGQPLSTFTREHLIARLAQYEAISLLAYDDEQAVGLLNAFTGFSTFACKPLINIHDLAVLPDYRGRGISLLLLDEIENIARENDCCKLTLEVLSENKIAASAYKKFGFSGYELAPEAGRAEFWEKKV
ncbi:GNAT family N-acetyltransferase [Gilvimarinus chinensis]|uniref:GNAT family N-acetyltransferase n=1 Tax=Gilvimarinus chinensis TaxID=396005 RepID=UPI0003808212|nr:GNAT family N-acetyltransferase [Gilvimarinus chinensis]